MNKFSQVMNGKMMPILIIVFVLLLITTVGVVTFGIPAGILVALAKYTGVAIGGTCLLILV